MTNIFNGESPRDVMTWRRLSRYIDALDSAGELRRVSDPIDCHLEAGTIADKLVKSQGPRFCLNNRDWLMVRLVNSHWR